MSPGDLKVHLPGSNPADVHDCDVCLEATEKGNSVKSAKVYCVSCPKKLCAAHETVCHTYSKKFLLHQYVKKNAVKGIRCIPIPNLTSKLFG